MNDSIFRGGAAFINGSFVSLSEAKISVFDWALSRSDVVYDVVGVVDGAFFQLGKHLERFEKSMAARRLDIGMSREDLSNTLHRMVALSGLANAYVAMLALRGCTKVLGSRNPIDGQNHLVAYAVPWANILPKERIQAGASMWIASHPRVRDTAVDPRVKNYQWQDLLSGWFEANDRNFDATVLCDEDGFVTEGPGYNIFFVKGGSIRTPDRGALGGITRGTVLQLCNELGIDAAIAPIKREALEEADEIFISSTAGGVMPIAKLGERKLKNGGRGPYFSKIHEAYWNAHKDARFIETVRYWAGSPADPLVNEVYREL